MIKFENEKIRYFDKNGEEILEGCMIRFESGRIEKVYLTEDGELGVDATNPAWLEDGRAYECQYGVYPLTTSDTNECEIVYR